MEAKYKLTYFNFHGRAEAARMIFSLAAVEFEDHRVDWSSEEWKTLKEKSPFGGLPLLEINGKVYCQSHAITRYLANKFGFAGKTELDKLQADMIVDCFNDVCYPLSGITSEADEAKKKVLWIEYEPKLEKHFQNLQKFLEENNGGKGFFVGDSITWVDCVWTAVSYWLRHLKYGPLLDKFPNLAAIKDRVEADPRIAAYIAKRPKADF